MSDNAATIWMAIVILFGMPISVGIALALVIWADKRK